MSTLRNWDYYNMTETFTDLHEKASQGHTFSYLYETIISRENILLAFRTIKTNKGSKTPGTDGKTIDHMKELSENDLVNEVRTKLRTYRPKKVRREWIEKENGKWRPLGIPCILDRVIQQCFKQVLEPIVESQFFKHSYGFRPLRSAHHAMARIQSLINHGQLHFVVDVDIKSFFDNVNHRLLKKQLWNIGIQDRKVLACISKMIKSEIDGEGVPEKGSPQGGILSPLLSNVVLNELDQWVADQWEVFPLSKSYSSDDARRRARKQTNLKQGYLVRYADDFKILCRDGKTAQRWYHAVRQYLKERLKLDISPEKSQIVNLRKRESEFLGFTIRANKKGKKRVAHTGVVSSKSEKIKQEAKKLIRRMKASPSAENIHRYNSFVLGLHQYFKRATHVSLVFSRLAYDLKPFLVNRLRPVGTLKHPFQPPPFYKRTFSLGTKTMYINGTYLFPIGNVKTYNAMNFSSKLSLYTKKGREQIHKSLRPDIQKEIGHLMKSSLPKRSIEYLDNRISRYSMKMGRCEVTGEYLHASEVHCHHYVPRNQGGTDQFQNLRILHKDIHRLIHIKDIEKIKVYLEKLPQNRLILDKINQYRKVCGVEGIDASSLEK
ncbi:group II intron reverse transcriptase/maturase [Halobacillus karajensis]|uniref:Group II intron-encoded protein LtrA n=1 Tax=Halobacillus karajensis TaxID=195088 RepID=A0A059NXU4_9BACI|nr:group II intron reverse transcriptase/maturase [Halobacillus karajensis]CDQ20189.1 Group II intron-encoded protein LtrA [Halobacillus karajensis]CDQ20190.1 Group II intron-encoded protein LtrA [Halobacillus karajensis]CDQ20336.1 Group II intron-encoded protein LtrA [Halobacillus karajensis]CDQ20339.1 Group II intron-encoded protein LtrA [Halobacillus karajensis]CDQ23593.1 Group II intron-encoded protein LtrA [Halobacillus karajensis]